MPKAQTKKPTRERSPTRRDNEILFTSNTDENPALKDQIDKVIESVQLGNPK
jgi:hypothetical protein